MNNNNFKSFINKSFLCLLFLSMSVFAQETTVSGVVTSSDKLPLPGANVIVKGTKGGTQTDFNGKFSIKISNNQSVLVVSYTGHKTKEIPVNGKTTFSIVLEEDASTLKEVVVIGYGSIKPKNTTGAVAKINSSLLELIPENSFQSRLAGKLAGVDIQQTSGAPGGNVSIRIRGVGSINGGNNPLIVIDGFIMSTDQSNASTQGSRPGSGSNIFENPQNPLSALNPNDIESVTVLKDAAAASIYGARGANGVMLITTKKGLEGKPIFSFDSSWGLQNVSKQYDMMDAYEFVEENYIARANAGTLAGFPSKWLPYLNDEPGLVNTNWQEELFRAAPMVNYDFSVKGGTKTGKYYISGNYANQEGIIIGSGMKRFAFRTNIDSQINDKIKIGVNFAPSLTINDLVPSDNPYFVDGVVNLALLSTPTESVYNPDGSFNYNQNTAGYVGPFVNPIAIATLYKDQLKQIRVLLGTFIEIDIFKNFKFKTQLNGEFANWNRAIYRPSALEVRNVAGPSNPIARNYGTQKYNWLIENTLTYDKTFNEKHKVTALVGYTAQKELTDRNGLTATDYANDFVETINTNSNTITSAFTQVTEYSNVGLLARVMYDYDGKYLLSASVRRDGSSRFGKDTKYANFPAVSAGWRLSDEKFFKVDFINDLKFRASYGERGNDQIGNYSGITRLGASNYVFDNDVVNGLAPNTSSNSRLTWEKNVEQNYGLDLALFKNKLVVTADYFNSKTEKLLFDIPVPGSTGTPGGSSLQNIGSVGNKGFELGLTSNLTFGNLKITTNANFTTIKNEILKFGLSDAPQILSGALANTYIAQIGQPLSSYYGYNVLGVFTTQDQLDNSAKYYLGSFIGDFRFEDVNNDGIINAQDRKILGNPFPDYTFGFSTQLGYNNIDFNIGIQGKLNYEVFHLSQRYLGNMETFSNYRADSFANAYISPENPGNGQVYRPNGNPTGGNQEISSYHIEDGSFIRIQNITLGYSLTSDLLKKLGNLQRFRVYATAVNPFTFTKYSGYNPDVSSRTNSALTSGEDYGTYPLSTNIIMGINLSF